MQHMAQTEWIPSLQRCAGQHPSVPCLLDAACCSHPKHDGGFPATAAVCDLIIASQHTQKATGEPNRYLIV